MTESNKYDKLIVLDIPIYCVEFMSGFILVVGAGGGQKYGVKNLLMTYKMNQNKICQTASCTIEYETEIPYFIKCIKELNIAVICLSDTIISYILNTNTGELKQVSSTKILEYKTTDIYLTTISFDETYKKAAFGSSEGLLM